MVVLACEPCRDCGEPLTYDPNVSFRFINFDSLVKLDTALSKTADSLNTLSEQEDSLNFKVSGWNQLMVVYRDSIENGRTEYVADTVKIYDSLSTAKGLLMEIDTAQLYTNEYNSFLDDARDLVLSGRVLVTAIEILETGNLITYEDSAETYAVPLVLQEGNQTNYSIDLDNEINTIGFSYTTEITVDVQRKVKLRANDLDTVNVTYDSLYFKNCTPPDCMDNEILVVIYF